MFNIYLKKLVSATRLRRLSGFIITTMLAFVLAACQTYDGFPTATPAPTEVPKPTTAPPATARPTLPPPPTATPRPELPATPAGVQLQKADFLKEGFDALLNSFYIRLDSGDIYEVGLKSMQAGLEQAGVKNPDVPIPNFGKQDAANWTAFLQAYTLVVNKYKAQVSEDVLSQLALNGAASSLQDCQTAYYPPDQANNLLGLRTNQYSNVGIGLNLQTGQLTNGKNAHFVLRAIPGGPADKAGLKLGDQLTSVEGQDISTKTTSEVVTLLRGNNPTAGSRLLVTFRRPSSSQDMPVEIIRANLQQPMMEQKLLPDNIGYLRFNSFPFFLDQKDQEDKTKQLDTTLATFDKANVKGIVLDLRGNSFGGINTMQYILSRFIAGDQLLTLSGVQRGQNNARQYGVFPMPSVENVKATNRPLAVLVDSGTTAEAEMFTYAIQQAKRGTIVGEATAGCLNASSPVVLKNNSLVNVTLYRVVSDPKKPDSLVEIVQPEEKATLDLQQLSQGKDSQIEAAVKILKK